MQDSDHNSYFDARPYRYKKARMTFFCPLCGVERAFVGKPGLTQHNYMQVITLTIVLSLILVPFLTWKSIPFILFSVWTVFELVVRMNYRQEVPCPHCGFDAACYKRDVKEARRKVEEFWARPGVSSFDEATDGEAYDPENMGEIPPQSEQQSQYDAYFS